MLNRLVATLLLASAAGAAPAHEPTSAPRAAALPVEARPAAATVDAFHNALRRGDTKAALSLLAPDALIFEEGEAERTRAEYAASHLAADSEYSRSVGSKIIRRAGGSDGKLAWVSTEGRTTGTFRGREVDRNTTETMVLRRIGKAWRIQHIHWSSAAARPSGPAMSTPLLAGSTPANGAVVKGPVETLMLHFSPPARLVEVTVSGPSGQMPMMVTPAGEQQNYTLPLPSLGPGNYSVDWRAIAKGREDRGTFAFTVN